MRRQGRCVSRTVPTVGNQWRLPRYAFGSHFDKDGNIWIALCLTGSFNSNSKFVAGPGKVTPDGKFVPTTSGVRSPGGVGFDAEATSSAATIGPWNGACV